ncbi:unnamed protein product [Ranitomeya imitator]|uniref:CCHC-type domain-containing protein n=1 Tax=Ranitomeya imitator TaxID=111125 RepID=A0ABN9KX06_9NEOB|nr:unnamed protein product [Ranitomeya imitator]
MIHDEPLSLCSRFEAMYRKVIKDQGIGIPQGMIHMFVEKFPYLDIAWLSAARELSLTDAAIIIEQCRQDLLLNNKKTIKVREHVPVHVKSQDEHVHHAKNKSTVLPTAPSFEKTGSIHCFHCLQYGHKRRNCPQWIRNRNNPEKSGNNNGKPNYARTGGKQTDSYQGHFQGLAQKHVAIVNAPAQSTVGVESNDSTKRTTVENPQVAIGTSHVPTGSLVNIN